MSVQEERSVSAVLTNIFANVQDMVRSEIHLAKAELKREAAGAARAGAFTAGGAVLALYALGFLLLAIMFLLARVLDTWLAALLVCLLVSGVAATLMAMGRHRFKRMTLEPKKTVQSVKENLSWIKNQIK